MEGPLFGRHENVRLCRADALCFLSPTFNLLLPGQPLKAVAVRLPPRVLACSYLRSFSLVSFIIYHYVFVSEATQGHKPNRPSAEGLALSPGTVRPRDPMARKLGRRHSPAQVGS